MKINQDYIIEQYNSGVDNYAAYTTEIGLWESEKAVFQKYLMPSDNILDLGCGTGRTTFALFKMGYEKIIGVDLCNEMILAAKALNKHFETQIPFETGNACDLQYESESFDAVIFSFNGIMSIPSSENRAKAFSEIARVVKDRGTFIFTTHDRDAAPEFFSVWEEQKKIWAAGTQDVRLFEYGDLITTSKNERSDIFIHIPDRAEVESAIELAGFTLIESFYRSEQFNESEAVKKKSGECRFWIAQKKN